MAAPTDTPPPPLDPAPIRIGAALFNGDHARLADEVARLEAAAVDFIHLDVFDGRLVPDLGFPPRTIAALRPLTKLPFEVHLGAIEPLRFVERLVEAGADLVLIHVESAPMLHETLFAIREHGVRVGLVFALGTPLAWLEPVVTLVDAVLLLARVTGEDTRGATFDPLVWPRLRTAREILGAASGAVELQVAGGVNRQHVAELAAAGADALALGAGLYRVADMGREVADLRRLAARG